MFISRRFCGFNSCAGSCDGGGTLEDLEDFGVEAANSQEIPKKYWFNMV